MDELAPIDELTDEPVSMNKLTNKSGPTNKLAEEADESAPADESARLDAVQQALKKSDAFSLIKPRLDQLAGLAGKDPSMVIEIQDTLAELEISLSRGLAA